MANVYSVEQVNNYIKNMFNSDFVLNRISVRGEVSNCKYHSSGHIYFTLKDNNNVLSAIMFAGNRGDLDFKLEDGMQVVVSGNITIYERDGRYQLYAKKIEKAGMGQLYMQFLEIKKELEEMGMFSPMYKQPIPHYIKTLGVVTASTGAVIKDIINVSTRRNPYIQIVLYPALVQGSGAVDSICDGIRKLDEYGVDTIIVGRGGGSIEDLWAFNDRRVAETVFSCRTPVISAVGHETDFTIIDFVSDMRAPTPSAAAELAVDDVALLMSQINNYTQRLNKAIEVVISGYKNHLDNLVLRLNSLSPANVLNNRKQYLDELYDRINRAVSDILNEKKNRLSVLCTRLDAISPIARLKSGYAYVTDCDNRAVTSIKDINKDDDMTINVVDGKIYVKVVDKA